MNGVLSKECVLNSLIHTLLLFTLRLIQQACGDVSLLQIKYYKQMYTLDNIAV